VAATNANLPRMADEGTFRADLLDRLSFEVVTLPPLRFREGDIPVLADYFGRRMAAELEWSQWPGLGHLASEALERHEWPGNVRELRNVIERAVYQWEDSSRPIDHIIFDPFESPWKPREMTTKENKQEVVEAKPEPVEESLPESGLAQVDDMKDAVEAYEKRILESALAKNRYNQRQTAKSLNLTYDQLRHSLKRHDLLGS